ncbi:MAG: DUF742 domain-containing protein [Nocardiopsaceae bacterium]|nr:DUF742 domain-containing protein [Nocardiopsaceae bacterium]
MADDDECFDWDDAGPVSRPYMVTGGRTRQRTTLRFDLIDLVRRTARPVGDAAYTPERRAILGICQEPVTVADLAAELGLALGVVRIVLDDLVQDGLIEVLVAAQQGWATDTTLLERVIEGIKSL